MNTLWHIVKKDLRRFWLLITVMAFVLIVKAFLLAGATFGQPAVPLNGTEALTQINHMYFKVGFVSLAGGILGATDFIILIALILGILLEDPPLGERTFWRTRPIANGQMLTAKAFYLFLVCWPLQAVLQVLTNFGNHPWYSALGELTLIQAAWVAVLAPIVLLWRNPILGAGALAAIWFGSFMLVDQIALLLPHTVGNEPDPLIPIEVIFLAVLFCTTVAVAAWMYCKRKRLMGFLIFGAGFVAMGLVACFF
jgi:hypothetical protein